MTVVLLLLLVLADATDDGGRSGLEQVLWVGEKWARSYVLERECRREIVAGGSPDARWELMESIPALTVKQ